DAAARRDAGLRLARDVVRFMDGPRPQSQSRLEPLHDVVEVLGPAWDAETDPAARAALARALEVTHKRLHERLKTDETAEGRAFRLARQRAPAPTQNAQSTVTPSLPRPGAPGLDAPADRAAAPRPTAPPAVATAASTPSSSPSEDGQ